MLFKEILLSDNSDDSDADVVTEDDVKEMLKDHVRRRKIHQKFVRLSEEVHIILCLFDLTDLTDTFVKVYLYSGA